MHAFALLLTGGISASAFPQGVVVGVEVSLAKVVRIFLEHGGFCGDLDDGWVNNGMVK